MTLWLKVEQSTVHFTLLQRGQSSGSIIELLFKLYFHHQIERLESSIYCVELKHPSDGDTNLLRQTPVSSCGY